MPMILYRRQQTWPGITFDPYWVGGGRPFDPTRRAEVGVVKPGPPGSTAFTAVSTGDPNCADTLVVRR